MAGIQDLAVKALNLEAQQHFGGLPKTTLPDSNTIERYGVQRNFWHAVQTEDQQEYENCWVHNLIYYVLLTWTLFWSKKKLGSSIFFSLICSMPVELSLTQKVKAGGLEVSQDN